MNEPLVVILPLISAICYAMAGVALKKAMEGGVRSKRVTAISSFFAAGVLLPFLFRNQVPLLSLPLWQPLVVAVIYVAGLWSSMTALSKGDASAVTPLLSTKVIFVAFFTTILLGQPVTAAKWIGTLLTVIAIALLRAAPSGVKGLSAVTLILAMFCAIMFALGDILLQQWGPNWDTSVLMSIFFVFSAMLSTPFMLGRSQQPAKKGVVAWTIAGAALLSVPAIGIGFTVATFGNATLVNIMFNSRGLWGVLLVWLFGKQLQLHESTVGRGVLALRLVGAALMLAGIVGTLV